MRNSRCHEVDATSSLKVGPRMVRKEQLPLGSQAKDWLDAVIVPILIEKLYNELEAQQAA